MQVAPYSILFILLVAMVLFIWGRWRYDIVALFALMISVAIGAVPYTEVYRGLANPAVITVACVMIISAAIHRSGILNYFVNRISRLTQNTVLHVGSLTFITGVLSAFMNNVGALALMMPIAIKTAVSAKRSPSTLLMPIALGSAMGGLCTLIGTPPNLLISAYRQKYSGQPFSMFSYGHVGIWIGITGIIFISLIGWRLLPRKRRTPSSTDELFQMKDYISEFQITAKSPLIDKTITDFGKLIQADFVVIGMIRKKQKKLVLRANQRLEANDILIIEAPANDIQKLLDVGKLELVTEHKISSEELQSDDISLMEAVVPQASRMEGQSSHSMRLHSRFQMNLLAIAREGKPFKERLNQVKLEPGDVILLQGPTDSLQENIPRLGLLPLSTRDIQISKQPKAFLALLIFLCAIVAASLKVIPVEIAFGGAALCMVLFNALPVRFLYDSIDWPIIILLAAMIPIGNALQSTGGTELIATQLLSLTGHIQPIYILGLVLIVTMTLSDFMNNAATTVVMAPIAVTIAKALHLHIDPFLMAVAIGASCSFLTPVGHQNNTLVMGPGGYKFTDYIRLGLPLEIIVVLLGVPLIVWMWPL